MESDLLRVWGIDVADVFDDDKPLSPARVVRLLSTLGEDSALAAAQRGGTRYQGWTTDRYILRKLAYSIDYLTYVTLRVNGQKRVSEPKPIDTPDTKDSQRRAGKNTFAAMARAAMNGERGER